MRKLSSVSFGGKDGTKANVRLGQKGQLKPKGSSHSPATAYPEAKGSYNLNTLMVVVHLQFNRMTSGPIAQPSHVYDSNFFLSSFYQCFCWTIRVSKHITKVFMAGILF